jgi:hypothetical protein
MQVNEWGPPGWKFLHTITFNYKPTPENKKSYKIFFSELNNVLPCPYCCSSFSFYSKAIPIDEYLETSQGLTYWLYVIHNLVNQKVCKPLVPFEDVVIEYEKIRAKCGKITAENQVEIKTCQLKQKEEVDNEYIKKYVKETFNTYREKTNNYIKKLFEDKENPNMDSLNEYCKS